MEYVYAALLLHKLKQNITEDNIANIIKATGVTPDDVRVKALVAALSEVNIEEALKAAPVASVAAIGAASSTASTPSAAAGAAQGEEEKKEEKKEEEALEGLSSLFG
jgi:large subunit ribosomal protein L12